ncbi:hypothetical protein Pcac1_g10765 [Phytophthora cactorum]|nr:hypothetical protein Pcac1_g10765 [Phytophthora cactorum]
MVSMCWRLAGLFLVANWAGNAVDAGLSPLSPNIFDEWRTGYRARDILRESHWKTRSLAIHEKVGFPRVDARCRRKIETLR